MKFSYFLVLLSSLIFKYGQAQPVATNVNLVTINDQILDSIEKRTIKLDGKLYGSVAFKFFENDTLSFEYHSFDVNSYAKNMSFLIEDTLKTVGFLDFNHFGFGYNVKLSPKDTCLIFCLIVSDEVSLKLHKGDELSKGLSLPCVSSKLILPVIPTFKVGEAYYGMVDLISSDFYEVEGDKERRVRIELTGYFKTEVNKL